jgi:hypothetical protein
LSELDDKIRKLEEEWERYHKNPRKYPMPNMIELTKLRLEKKNARV